MDEAFLQAILAEPDDDTPRLIYADWLDEHGDRDRAEFIRVDCRRATLPEDHPEHVDLAERRLELVARLNERAAELAPALPPVFNFGSPTWDADYKRGFPARAHLDTNNRDRPAAEELRAGGDGLEHLIARTTVRHLSLKGKRAKEFSEVILGRPAAAELRGLTIHRPEARYPGEGLPELLTRAKLDRLTHLGLDLYTGTPESQVDRFTSTDWFHRLRDLWLWIGADDPPAHLVPRITAIRSLETFRCADLSVKGLQALAQSDGFPSLTRLGLIQSSPLDPRQAVLVARSKCPRLAHLALVQCSMNDAGLDTLLQADWFGQLRSLDLSGNNIGNKGVAALAAAPAAASLRVLRLGNNDFQKDGLDALARARALVGLTTLDLHTTGYPRRKRYATTADVAAFLADLRLARLRHLDLSGWPVGDEAAQVIAGSPAFASLTRLILSRCGVSNIGRDALLASDHLRGLVQLVV